MLDTQTFLTIVPLNMSLWLFKTTAFPKAYNSTTAFFFFKVSSVHTIKWSLNLQSDREKEAVMPHSTYL